MPVNETVITAIVTIFVTLFGKEFWDFWKNRDIIKGQVDTLKKIKGLEEEIHDLETERDQLNIAVTMMLKIFEGKYGEEYKTIIDEVKKYLKPIKIK